MVILEINQLSWTPLPSRDIWHGIIPHRSLKKSKACSDLLKSRVIMLFFLPCSLLSSSWALPSWSLQLRLLPALISPTGSSLFLSKRWPSLASQSSMHTINVMWFTSHRRTRVSEHEAFKLSEEDLNRFLSATQSAADIKTSHQFAP